MFLLMNNYLRVRIVVQSLSETNLLYLQSPPYFYSSPELTIKAPQGLSHFLQPQGEGDGRQCNHQDQMPEVNVFANICMYSRCRNILTFQQNVSSCSHYKFMTCRVERLQSVTTVQDQVPTFFSRHHWIFLRRPLDNFQLCFLAN